MKTLVKTMPRNNSERQNYEEKIKIAISYIDEAINHISYTSNLIDCDTGKNINKDLIDDLNEIIYKLEDYKDKYVFKPYDIMNNDNHKE